MLPQISRPKIDLTAFKAQMKDHLVTKFPGLSQEY